MTINVAAWIPVFEVMVCGDTLTIMTPQEQHARTSATWYAWGRNDAEGTHHDVFAFADFYVEQRSTRGHVEQGSTRGQSIQDAYKTFVAAAS